MARQSLVIAGVLFLSLVVSPLASATSPDAPPPEQQAAVSEATFAYTPASRAAPGSGGVTFGVGNEEYLADANNPWPLAPQFARLGDALKQDLVELLMAKGFGVRGPFSSYDLIPYPDKKAIDLYLAPTLQLSTVFKDTNVETQHDSRSGKVYHGTGTIEVKGTLTVKLQEPMSRELMWTKGIPFSYAFPYDVRFPYFEKGTRPFDFKLVMDDLAKGLAQQYPVMLTTLSGLIDPEEMRVIKRQAQELKRKKGY